MSQKSQKENKFEIFVSESTFKKLTKVRGLLMTMTGEPMSYEDAIIGAIESFDALMVAMKDGELYVQDPRGRKGIVKFEHIEEEEEGKGAKGKGYSNDDVRMYR